MEINILMGVGLCFCLIGVGNLVKIFGRRDWPKVEGTITSSKIETHASHGHNVLSKTKPLNTYKVESHTAKVRYEYEIDGNRYFSTKVFSAAIFPTAVSDILPFTDGSKQLVSYDPKNPLRTYLVSSPPYLSCILTLLGSLILAYEYSPEWFRFVGVLFTKYT